MNFSVMSEADCLKKIKDTQNEPTSKRREMIECIAGLTACQSDDVKEWLKNKGYKDYIPYYRDPDKVREENKRAKRMEKRRIKTEQEAKMEEAKVTEEVKEEKKEKPVNVAFDNEVVLKALHGYIDGMVIRVHRLREQREDIAKEIEKLELETEKALAIYEAYNS